MCPSITKFSRFLNFETLQRNFKIVLLGLLLLVVVLVVSLSIISADNNELAKKLEKERKQVCLTPSCIQSAGEILNNMDSSVNPCYDFYQFACGGFLKKTTIPNDKANVSPFTKVRSKVYEQLLALLEQPPQSEEIKPIKLMKQFYGICMNTTIIEEDSLVFIKVILESLGGWPVLDGEDWNNDKFDWKTAIFALKQFGYPANYFISVDVIRDITNTSQQVITFNQAKLGLSHEILVKGVEDEIVQAYYNYMVEVAVLFGANQSFAYNDLRESLQLEIELAKISVPYNELAYQPISIAALRKLYPDANWKEYLKYLLDIPNFEIRDDERILLQAPLYFYGLEDVLKATTKRVQANYIMWRAVSSSIPYLTFGLKMLRLEFLKKLHGEPEMHPLWMQCTSSTLHYFWRPLSILYEETHSNDESKQIITEMLTHIENEFVRRIQNVDWMDDRTKEEALKKAKALPIDVGFATKENHDLNEYYSTLNLTSNNYLMSALAISHFQHNHRFRELRQQVKQEKQYVGLQYGIDNKQELDMVQVSSVQFTLLSITFLTAVLLGIFQTIFFHHERPQYANYGAVGSIIAHMVTHVFDNHGRNFNENGDLVEWWTEDTKNAFDEKSRCIVDQYGKYKIAELGINLDGEKTRDENIAENTGVEVAYLAYKTWVDHNGPEPQIPSLNFTAQQLFWIFYANMWCEKYREEELKYFLSTTSFPPASYALIGSVANSKYFSQDFGCPLNSRMNPKNKCKIW